MLFSEWKHIQKRLNWCSATKEHTNQRLWRNTLNERDGGMHISTYWPELAPIELYLNQLKGFINKAAFSNKLKAEFEEFRKIVEPWIANVALMKVRNTWKKIIKMLESFYKTFLPLWKIKFILFEKLLLRQSG